MTRRTVLRSIGLLVAGATSGCAGTVSLVRRDELDPGAAAGEIRWFGPEAMGHEPARWRAGVGPPFVHAPIATGSTAADAITFVSWNTHVGAGDVAGLVQALPNPNGPVVLLLQEVYRSGPDVPGGVDRGTSFARHIGDSSDGRRAREITAVAEALGLGVFYAPSMRNGGTRLSPEDRGNAILSNLPFDDLFAVELPFEHQRRVAVGATVAGETSAGTPWRVRFVCVHLLSTGGVKHAWVATESHRARQARALTALLHDGEPTVLAGDFNTMSGFTDQTYVETARAFPDTRVVDRRATFLGFMRLDLNVFVRPAPGWRAEFRRAASRFGSDHYPLVGTLRFH